MISGNPTVITSVIDGTPAPVSGVTVTRENPGRKNEAAVHWCAANSALAAEALNSAAAANGGWAMVSREDRCSELAAFLEKIERHAREIVPIITRENGKTLQESAAEISGALADARFLLEDAQRDEPLLTSRDPSVETTVVLEPMGVVLLATPWNFPVATILRKLVPALAFGNVAIVKPSELTPGSARFLFDLLRESPKLSRAAALLFGRGPELVPQLLRHDVIRAVSFTGSTAAGVEIARTTAGKDVRLQLEMGGKNTAVVLDDADLDLAAVEIVRGAFSCAGQWCTGTGRVVASAAIAAPLLERLVAHANRIRVGPGDDPDTQMGPVVSANAVERTVAQIEAALQSGARLRAGGATAASSRRQDGHFLAPTVISGVTVNAPLWTEELFAPVVPVAVAQSDDEAVKLANAGRYGLSASVFSRNEQKALQLGRQIEAGMLHVNLHTAYRDAALPVGGWRDSGRGTPECGRFARDFFTRPRAVYVKRSS